MLPRVIDYLGTPVILIILVLCTKHPYHPIYTGLALIAFGSILHGVSRWYRKGRLMGLFDQLLAWRDVVPHANRVMFWASLLLIGAGVLRLFSLV